MSIFPIRLYWCNVDCQMLLSVSLAVVISLSQSQHHQHLHHPGDQHVLAGHHHLMSELGEALAGSGQMFGQSVAAGLAQNSQWFQPEGVTDSACEDEASTATLQQGWPSTGDLVDMSGGICWRRRRLFLGGSWGPWRYVKGSVRETFLPNFLNGDAPAVPGEIIVETK